MKIACLDLGMSRLTGVGLALGIGAALGVLPGPAPAVASVLPSIPSWSLEGLVLYSVATAGDVNGDGRRVPSGVYFRRVEAGRDHAAVKLLILR